jgi:hypothetical protein
MAVFCPNTVKLLTFLLSTLKQLRIRKFTFFVADLSIYLYFDVCKALKRLRPSEFVGLDDIHTSVMKGSPDIVLRVLKCI